ncbi:MAG: hemerythrin domain-containing protein [Rhizobacter sp.]|nr:hemerythrin domain-containing protein [Rhizobacter sp.]
MTTTPRPNDPNAPIENFSQCHVGIVANLNALGGLPALLAPATQAHRLASDALGFFSAAVIEHHREEAQELFPAVLASAVRGEGRDRLAPQRCSSFQAS